MTIILNNAYQSGLISLMITPSADKRIHTFDKLAMSNFKFIADPFFKNYLKSTGEYSNILENMRETSEILDISCAEAAKENYAIINPCEDFDWKYFNLVMSKEHVANYYVMKERILSYYRFYTVDLNNGYLKNWQYYMDWSFAGGLDKYWDVMFSLEISTKHEIKNNESNDAFLNLEDLKQTFYLLLIGLFAGCASFLLEILSQRISLFHTTPTVM